MTGMSLLGRITGERTPKNAPAPSGLSAWPQPSLSRAIARAGATGSAPIFVARQPIYNGSLETWAYELVFGHGGALDDRAAGATTLVATLADIGLEALVGRRAAFISVPVEFVLQGLTELMPAGRLALQLRQSVAAREDVLPALTALAAAGHPVVIDDFVARPDTLLLLEIASVVKIDVAERSEEQLTEQVRLARSSDAKLLARGVDRGSFERCRQIGFDLFQGELLGAASTVTGRTIAVDHANQMQLLAALQDPAAQLEDLDAVISRDLGVSYRLLRWINSAAFALPRRVTSVHEAIVLLGERNVRNWAMLVALAREDGQPGELLRTGLVRARMCEEIARRRGRPDPEAYFTVGLFSIIDACMGMSMEDVLDDLPLADEVRAALLRGEGPFGDVLGAVREYEAGRFGRLHGADEMLRDSYLAAVRWADESTRALMSAP
jgi:c-di-GMP phosphodiesterase